jgi:hypothetical protein
MPKTEPRDRCEERLGCSKRTVGVEQTNKVGAKSWGIIRRLFVRRGDERAQWEIMYVFTIVRRNLLVLGWRKCSFWAGVRLVGA